MAFFRLFLLSKIKCVWLDSFQFVSAVDDMKFVDEANDDSLRFSSYFHFNSLSTLRIDNKVPTESSFLDSIMQWRMVFVLCLVKSIHSHILASESWLLLSHRVFHFIILTHLYRIHRERVNKLYLFINNAWKMWCFFVLSRRERKHIICRYRVIFFSSLRAFMLVYFCLFGSSYVVSISDVSPHFKPWQQTIVIHTLTKKKNRQTSSQPN